MNQIEYKTKDGNTQIEVQFEKKTAWLTQQQITTLFEKDTPVAYYNLDVIISVGYRLKSMCEFK